MSDGFKVHDGAYPHFITNSICYLIPIFRRDDYFRMLVDSLNYCTDNKGLIIHAYVLMPDHFHCICSQRFGKLSDAIRDLKRHTSTAIVQKLQEDNRTTWLRAFKNAGDQGKTKLWDEDYHPEQVHSPPFFEQKLRYVHGNPIRAGFVENPEDWKYSSAGFYYLQRESLVKITPIEW